MLRLLSISILVFGLVACASQTKDQPKSSPERIDRSQSKLDVRILGLSNDALRYYYRGWNDTYTIESYSIFYRHSWNGQFLYARIGILVTDEYYWEGASEVTVESIKRFKYFKNRDVTITFKSAGMNAYSDSVAEGPNYLLFTANTSNCGAFKRFSVLGPHGGTTIPRSFFAIYCPPDGKELSKEQAAAIAKTGLIFVEKPSGDASTQLSKAVIDPVQAGLIAAGSPNPPAAQRSARSSIHKLFSGTTLARNEGSANVIEVFSTDGTMTGKRVLSGPNVNGIPDEDSGKWSTDNEGRICLAWAKWNEGKTSCHAVSTGDRTIRLLSPSGWVLREYAVLSRPEPKPVAKPKREKPPKVARIEIKPEEIPDGELSADQIKALLTGTNVALANPVNCHEFDMRGSDCRIYHAFQTSSVIRTTSLGDWGSEEENGRWWVQDKNSLCLEWPSWFGGKQQCYRVIKTGMKMMLTDSRGWSTVYLIEEK